MALVRGVRRPSIPLPAGKSVRYLTVMPRLSRKPPVYSKVSVKSQTVLPRAVRETLGVKAGDTIRYRMIDEGVLIDKAPPSEADDPFAAFSEWSGAADDKAYADL